MLIAVVFFNIGTASAQEATDGLIQFESNTILTQQQQHYLDNIKTFEQYVRHHIVKMNTVILEDYNYITLQLDQSMSVVIVKHHIEYRSTSDWSWFGNIQHDERGSANIVVHGDMVTANFRFDGLLYSIRPLGEGLHVLCYEDPGYFRDHPEGEYEQIEEIDWRNTEQEIHHDDGRIERYIPNELQEEAFEGHSRGVADCNVRIIVAFTDDVEAANADPRGEIQLAVDNWNSANDNSEVNWDIEIAAVYEVTYSESGNLTTDRDRFRIDGDGIMDNVHDLRQLYDADYCQLIVTSPGCGLAAGIGSTYSTAFAVSKYSCIAGNLTFAHEMGHLHGCRHDTYVDATTTPYAWGHGFVNVANSWRTVMSYNDECDDGGGSCTRIQYWSTPDVNPTGWGGGVAGTSGTEKNERVLDDTEVSIAGYEALVTNKSVYDPETILSGEEGNFQGNTTVTTVSSTSTYLDYRNGSKGEIKAGSSITLNAGFWARSGSDFTAFLETCNAVTSRLGLLSTQEENTTELLNDIEEGYTVTMNAYPNPFSSLVKFGLYLPQDDHVKFSIYNMFGKEIAVLAERELAAGKYVFNFNSSNHNAGIYNVVLITSEKQMVKRIVKARE